MFGGWRQQNSSASRRIPVAIAIQRPVAKALFAVPDALEEQGLPYSSGEHPPQAAKGAAHYHAIRWGTWRIHGHDCQNPTISLADNVAVMKRAVAEQNGPVILVGHSYGGVVITEAGNDPKVAGLVYVTAFAPDKDESAASLIKNAPQGAPAPPILPPPDGYLFLDKAKFPASFAADVSPDVASLVRRRSENWLRRTRWTR